MEHGPGLKMYFLLIKWGYSIAMLVYQRGYINICRICSLKPGRSTAPGPKPWTHLQDLQNLCKPLGFSLLTSELNELKDWVTETFFFLQKNSWGESDWRTQGGGCSFSHRWFPDFCILFVEGLKPLTSVDILSTDTLNVHLIYENWHCLQGLLIPKKIYGINTKLKFDGQLWTRW